MKCKIERKLVHGKWVDVKVYPPSKKGRLDIIDDDYIEREYDPRVDTEPDLVEMYEEEFIMEDIDFESEEK
jgi:hypothetical protein